MIYAAAVNFVILQTAEEAGGGRPVSCSGPAWPGLPRPRLCCTDSSHTGGVGQAIGSRIAVGRGVNTGRQVLMVSS